MSIVHELTRRDARRLAVRAQLLDARRPTGFLQVVRHLIALQLDPTSAIAPSAHLVLWSRLGSAYSSADLAAAFEAHTVVDLRGMLRPSEHIALFRAEMEQWPGVGDVRNYRKNQAAWVAANDNCRRDILRRLRSSGPMTSRELPDTCVKPWASSGWNNNRNVVMMLDFMTQRGEVAVAGREGRDRLWDLAERVYPDVDVVPFDEAVRTRNVHRLRSLGIARARSTETPVEPTDVGDAGEPAVIEGVAGEWRVDPEQLGLPFEGRAALLSPFDRLIHDRARMADLFEFEYALEMYKPVDKRRWGYYALPILFEDRLVGKLDATFDRKAGELRVDGVHEDVTFTKAMARAVDHEIADLAAWLAHDPLHAL
ncbi:MAG: YcaQ family DNA glycosylase [Actinobacteria bacterium]|nr:YcaQ family DNA glycosylase [Actinomycetota bacterium]